jgi:thioredoxin-related protein
MIWMLVIGWSVSLGAVDQPSPWREDFPALLNDSKDRPLALLFSIPSCSWCTRMLTESAGDAEVRQVLQTVVGGHVHAEQHQELATRLGITGYPTVVLVNRRRQIVRMIPGYTPAADLAAALRTLAQHGDEDGTAPFEMSPPLEPAAIAKAADAVPRLVALLGTGDVEQRSRVRTELARLPAARAALWTALDDPRLGVRVDAAAALAGQIGATAGYDPLAEVAQRRAMIAAWRAAAPPEAAPVEKIP